MIKGRKMRFVFVIAVVAMFAASALAQTSGTKTIKLYFLNIKDDPNLEDCRAVKPTLRTIPNTPAIARAALDELFKGVTPAEEAKGFTGLGPEETAGALKSINIKNGAAYVNFSKIVIEKLGTATTSCGSGFFSSIEATLKQFSTIRKVYYAIEGNSNDFYGWVQVGECPNGRKHCAASNFK
jgi:spore germination protein GerM